MSCYIGHTSALEYWRTHERKGLESSQARPRHSQPKPPTSQELEAAQSMGIPASPLEILVARPEDRRPSSAIKPHIWSEQKPRRSFVKVSEGIYLSTPEACFLQLARDLPLVSLVKTGFELTGSYSSCATDNSTFTKLEPRTTLRKLEHYLGLCKGERRVSKAQKALGFIAENSASPMETALTMLLTLPSSMGGFALPSPQLNYPVRIIENDYLGLFRELRCDLCWPEFKFVLEYDSDSFHSGSDKINSDSKRRADLERAGYRVISVTKKQVFNMMLFEDLANITARHIDKRLRITRSDFRQRQWELRKELLSR